MGDLIGRSALIESINKIITEHEGRMIPSIFVAQAVVLNQPTIEAAPVVHGEWIDTEPGHHNGFYRNAHKCSNCQSYYTTDYDEMHFCPNCGARMAGRREHE